VKTSSPLHRLPPTQRLESHPGPVVLVSSSLAPRCRILKLQLSYQVSAASGAQISRVFHARPGLVLRGVAHDPGRLRGFAHSCRGIAFANGNQCAPRACTKAPSSCSTKGSFVKHSQPLLWWLLTAAVVSCPAEVALNDPIVGRKARYLGRTGNRPEQEHWTEELGKPIGWTSRPIR
jgi:hypothetical protein